MIVDIYFVSLHITFVHVVTNHIQIIVHIACFNFTGADIFYQERNIAVCKICFYKIKLFIHQEYFLKYFEVDNSKKPKQNTFVSVLFFLCSVFKRFETLDPDSVSRDKNAKLNRDTILKLPELQVLLYSVFMYLYSNQYH